MRTTRIFASISLLLAVGCYSGLPGGRDAAGTDSGSAGSGASDSNTGGSDSDTGGTPSCDTPQPGPSPLRRLTRLEYNNTVRDLLGVTSNPANLFPDEEKVMGFENNAEALTVSLLLAEGYEDAARTMAENAIADMNGLLGCDPVVEGEDVCVDAWLRNFGKRVYRRPLTDAEHTRLLGFFNENRAAYDFQTGVKQVLSALLMSADFLYRVEFGMPDPNAVDAIPLTDHEIATRLSYLLWRTTPHEDLLEAADLGMLNTPEAVAQWAEWMLADPRGQDTVIDFQRQWLELDMLQGSEKDAGQYPDWNPAFAPMMETEVHEFWKAVVFEDEGTFRDLMSAPFTVVNDELAAYYGLPGVAGPEFRRVELDPQKQRGLLTLGGFIAAHSSENQTNPVKRGVFIREKVLCQPLPPPPPDIDIIPPEPDPNATTRERFEQHTADPVCAGCHHLIDGIGFGFEKIDGAGRYRALENGFPIDASGEILGTTDADGEYDGVPELALRFAESEQVRSCFVTQWFRFAHGRIETEEDSCNLQKLNDDFVASDTNIKALLIALTQTDAFMYRSGN